MAQDPLIKAKERYDDATDAFREQRVRMVEDMKFSNPADPQQWDTRARQVRESGPDGARPCLTLDRTNQYIAQVVNDARKNKPGPVFMPVTGGARAEVAKALDGIARHIEYQSRAQIAYDTGIEHAARIGLGWIRVVPEVCNAELNHQEIRIRRVHDPLSVICDPDWTEPDGSDIQYGFVETRLTDGAFKRKYPKAKNQTWDTGHSEHGWFEGNSLRIVEYFEKVKTKTNNIVIQSPDGTKQALAEDQYWTHARSVGYQPMVVATYDAEDTKVIWRTMTGMEVLEETEFPSRWIPLIPVIGYELWIEGKRYLCGMTRRMMDGQRLLNYERSAWAESVALQPRAPIMADADSIAGHEQEWNRMNRANLAYLPFNSRSTDGQPLPTPQRMSPPSIPTAFAQGAQFAEADIQASIGMYGNNLGATTAEHSGVAIRAKQQEGDVANFHYVDNLSRSIEHVWRIALDMIPRIYDSKREARILGADGASKPVMIDPEGDAYSEDEKGSTTINLATGTYDVRVKTGPAYTTMREEAAANLTQLMQGQPALAAVVAPIWARMQDWPEADSLAKALLAMAPPPVQAALQEGKGEDASVLKQQLQQAEQQMQQMHHAIDMASQKIHELMADKTQQHAEMLAKAAELSTADYKAETDRMKVLGGAMTPDKVAALVNQLFQDAMSKQPIGAASAMQSVTPADMAMPNPMAPQPEPFEAPGEPPDAEDATDPQQPAEAG